MNTRHDPSACTRRVLLCVSGMTPQIVTETLQALLEQSPPFVPSEIRVVTTAAGRDKAQRQLLDAGHLVALCADHGVATPPLDFTLIAGPDGEPLEDIRNDADNTAAADCILATVRKLTQDEGCAIHASLAGGRKTMSHYMGYALSLFGRPHDRLSHVLVAPDWAERAVDFHYVPKAPVELFDRSRNPLGRSDAVTVTLADIPLLRLGDSLPRLLREGRASFSETVRLANLALGPATLKLDLRRRLAECSGISVELSPANFAFLAWLAVRAEAGEEGIAINEWADADVEQFLDVYAAVVGYDDPDSLAIGYDRYVEADRTLRCDTRNKQPDHLKKILKARKDSLTSRRGDLVETLERQLGKPLAACFLPPAGKRGETRYFLELAPEAIDISGSRPAR